MTKKLEFYLCRDENGSLWLTDKKPRKDKKAGVWKLAKQAGVMNIDAKKFPQVTWEDTAATTAEIYTT